MEPRLKLIFTKFAYAASPVCRTTDAYRHQKYWLYQKGIGNHLKNGRIRRLEHVKSECAF